MAKFYIQSRNVSFVVSAHDAEGAALWAMHQIIESKVDESNIECEASIYLPMLDGLAEFDETILCSEIGLGRDEAGVLDTDTIFRHWRQLMKAADSLFDQLN